MGAIMLRYLPYLPYLTYLPYLFTYLLTYLLYLPYGLTTSWPGVIPLLENSDSHRI